MKTAILLFNMGGPQTLKDVRPFLRAMFNDPAILPGTVWRRRFLAWLISSLRAPVSRRLYATLGGGSPLGPTTEAQARALEAACRPSLAPGDDLRCFVVMRYTQPSIAHVWPLLEAYGPDRIVRLPLYPQFSWTTTGSSLAAFDEAWQKKPFDRSDVRTIMSYPDDPLFIAAWVQQIKKNLLDKNKPTRLLLAAHGLPLSHILAGDPYQNECEKTVQALVKALSEQRLFFEDTRLVYQSRLGPQKWLGPSLTDEIKQAAKEQKAIMVAPIAFVSEHVETLVELDQEAKQLALSLGCPSFTRVPTFGCFPPFIEALAQKVHHELT